MDLMPDAAAGGLPPEERRCCAPCPGAGTPCVPVALSGVAGPPPGFQPPPTITI